MLKIIKQKPVNNRKEVTLQSQEDNFFVITEDDALLNKIKVLYYILKDQIITTSIPSKTLTKELNLVELIKINSSCLNFIKLNRTTEINKKEVKWMHTPESEQKIIDALDQARNKDNFSKLLLRLKKSYS